MFNAPWFILAANAITHVMEYTMLYWNSRGASTEVQVLRVLRQCDPASSNRAPRIPCYTPKRVQ